MMTAAMDFLWPSMEFFWPSWWEVQVTVVTAAFVVVAYWYFTLGCDGGGGGGDDRTFMATAGADVIPDKEKIGQFKGDPQTNSAYVIKVIIPFGDIDEIKRAQHALINPAITIILRTGAGGHGVPPLGSPDGRVRYMFASFWNRNHALRAIQRAVKNYHEMLESEKKI